MLRMISRRFAVPMLVWAAATFGMGQFPASGQSFFEPIGAGGPPQAPVVQATAEFTAPAAGKPAAGAQKPTTPAEVYAYTGADRQQILEEGAKREGKILFYTTMTVNERSGMDTASSSATVRPS